jgi:PAS domain S-box-containing protein/diguanylate cyclase (GGDEF)-like protein
MHILVVEDDVPIRRLVRNGLERQGVEVEEAGTVAEAMSALRNRPADLIILDLTLPDGTGLEILTHVREQGSEVHVIVLSGAITELDRVQALHLGADDYVVKPFFVRELTARVLAIERRRKHHGTGVLTFDEFEIDLTAKRVLIDGKVIDLTAKEFALLAFLAARPGHVFSRADLLRAVWQSAPEWQSAKTVTEHVRRLGKKITVTGRPILLHTVPGSGYRFDPPSSPTTATQAEEPAVLTLVDGFVVEADESTARLLGAPDAAALLGKHANDLISADSLQAAQGRLALRDAGVAPRSQVMLFRHMGGGRELPITVSSSAADWDGHPASRVEMRRADESVRLRHLFTGVLSELTDAVIVTDMQSHIRSWNLAAERVYGWQEAEVLGRHILDVVAWGSGEELLASARAQLEVTGRWYGEGHQLTRDGNMIAVRASTNVVRDERGDAIGIVSVNRPVELDTVLPHLEPSARDIADLRRGITAGELVVFYQPVVDLKDGFVITVEALVRWRHPIKGLIGPEHFIDVAERSGMIIELGAFVLAEACRQVGTWRRDGWDINLAVNLSAKELADPALVERVTAIAATEGFDLHALWLEVTETALVEDVDAASLLLYRLADLGVGISIDDFGTGWASLTYLRQFPVHVLKIDRSFVVGIDQDASSAAIARSILSLGAELELVVVAEGIESEAEADVLRGLGCSVGQGYLYGRPSAADQVDLSRFRRVPAAPEGHVAAPSTRNGSRKGMTAAPAATTIAELIPDATDVTGMLRALFEIRSASAATALMQHAVHQLGGTLSPVNNGGPDMILIDVSLGEGPPIFASAAPGSAISSRIETLIPPLVEDAKQAIALLRRHEPLRVETSRDALTGLANRRVLERILPRVEAGVVIIIELDRSTEVGAARGTAIGDALIATFGGVLVRSSGHTDLCCRVGLEEFVVITADPDLQAALDLVRRVQESWAVIRPEPVTLSAGAAEITARGGPAALLSAGRALDRARDVGPDRVEVAS